MTDAVVELERLARFAQVGRGLVPEWATRPMLPHEARSGVNFVEMDDIMRRGYGLITQVLRDYLAVLVTSLGSRVGKVTDLAAVAAVVTAWATNPPAELDEAARDAASQVDEILAGVFVAAAAQVVREATFQGALVDPTPVDPPGRGRFLDEAVTPVTMLRSQVVMAVLNQSQGRANADQVLKAAGDVSQRQAEDLGRQAVHVAHGAGRAKQMESVGPTPKEVYASELLDGRTCGPCRAIDGRSYGSLREALFDYPNAGGYRDCKGQSRCRGTLVVVWGSEADPTR